MRSRSCLPKSTQRVWGVGRLGAAARKECTRFDRMRDMSLIFCLSIPIQTKYSFCESASPPITSPQMVVAIDEHPDGLTATPSGVVPSCQMKMTHGTARVLTLRNRLPEVPRKLNLVSSIPSRSGCSSECGQLDTMHQGTPVSQKMTGFGSTIYTSTATSLLNHS